jgi:hypothetical protein
MVAVVSVTSTTNDGEGTVCETSDTNSIFTQMTAQFYTVSLLSVQGSVSNPHDSCPKGKSPFWIVIIMGTGICLVSTGCILFYDF